MIVSNKTAQSSAVRQLQTEMWKNYRISLRTNVTWNYDAMFASINLQNVTKLYIKKFRCFG